MYDVNITTPLRGTLLYNVSTNNLVNMLFLFDIDNERALRHTIKKNKFSVFRNDEMGIMIKINNLKIPYY